MQSLNPYLKPILNEIDHYLDQYPQTNEHQIIKHLQDKLIEPFDNFSLSHSKDLFSAHFLCMHALYHLKNEYSEKRSYALIIQSVRVQRFDIRQYEDNDLQNTKQYLDRADPLASYYLNPKHYFETQEDEINDMLKSFWQRYLAQDEKQEALTALELPGHADKDMIKRQYRRLAQKHHPDKGGCAIAFNKIQEAKTVLDKAL